MMTNTEPQNYNLDRNRSGNNATWDEVAKTAYYRYIKNGSQDGNDIKHWLEAEEHVHLLHNQPQNSDRSTAFQSIE